MENREKISTLKRLQEIDRKLAHLRRMKEYEPRRLAEAEAKVRESEKLQDQLKEDQSDKRKRAGLIELDIKAKEEKISRHKSQMLTASSNREYQSFMKELSLEQVEKERSEEGLLEIMIEIDAFAEREKNAKAEIARVKEETADVQREVKAALAEIEASEGGVMKAREEVAALLDADTLRHYERLFTSRAGEAVVKASYQAALGRSEGTYVCTGCHMSLSHQMVNLLLLGGETVHCRSCGRILFVDENAEAEV